MEHKALDYPFDINPLPEDEGGGWVLSYPDVPHLIVAGDDIDGLIAEGRRVLADALALLAENGHPIPKPGSGSGYKGHVSIRMPKSLHATLAARAKAEGVSLNNLLVSLVSYGLGQKEA
jgi:antitoxin HicB